MEKNIFLTYSIEKLFEDCSRKFKGKVGYVSMMSYECSKKNFP